jgi:hypothetical protein
VTVIVSLPPPPRIAVMAPGIVAVTVNASSPDPSETSTISSSWYVMPAANVSGSGAPGAPKSNVNAPVIPSPVMWP